MAPTTIGPSSVAPVITPATVPAATTPSVPFLDQVNANTAPPASTNPNVPATVNSTDITSSPGAVVTPTASQPEDLTSLLKSLATAIQPQQDAKDTAAKALNTNESDLANLSALLGDQSQFSSDASTTAGIPDLTAKLNNLRSLQAFQTNAYLQGVQNVDGKPIALEFQQGQEASLYRQHALDALATSAMIDSVNNDISTAQAKVDKLVSLKFDPIKAQIATKQFIIQQNRDQLTDAQKELADAKSAALDIESKQVDQHIAQTKDAISQAMDAAKSGLVNENTVLKAVSDLTSGKTDLGGFYSAIGIDQATGSPSGSGSAVINSTLKLMGAASDMPVSQAISSLGMAKLVSGLVTQEGGSPKGVLNNPGNIKFVGLPGQVDSGVKATDGGTFASYATPAAGQAAVASLVQRAADSGKNLSDFIAAYKGVKSDAPTYAQYGLLSNTDFNPSNSRDTNAKAYIDYYLKNGSTPPASALGISTRGGAGQAQLSATKARADALYYQATGSSMPDPQILKATKNLINTNNKVLNNNELASSTIAKNFQLAIDGEITNDVNKNATIVNRILNPIYLSLGDPAVNQALVSNGTISQEFANLISIRNAYGTTQADKEMGSELIRFGTSVEAQKAVVQRLAAEATNIHSSLKEQNAKLYAQIDPLELDPNNPNRNVATQSAPGSIGTGTSSNFRSSYNY